jgi:hypothetical protein
MTRWEQSWAADVLGSFAPAGSGGGLTPLPGEVDYLATMRRMVQSSTPLAGFGLRVALWMVVFAPFWLLGRWVTFSKLALRDRVELLSRLLRHTSFVVRELSLLLKLTAAIALLGTPSVRARSGYDGLQPPAAQLATLRIQRVAPPVAALGPVEPLAPHAHVALRPSVAADAVKP